MIKKYGQVIKRLTAITSKCFKKPLCILFTVSFSFLFFFFFFIFLGPHLWHMEVPRLGVEQELQPTAYTTVTAMSDLSCLCNLHHSSWQHWILNPLSEVRDQTRILMDSSRVCYHWATMGTPFFIILKSFHHIIGELTTIYMRWLATYFFKRVSNNPELVANKCLLL